MPGSPGKRSTRTKMKKIEAIDRKIGHASIEMKIILDELMRLSHQELEMQEQADEMVNILIDCTKRISDRRILARIATVIEKVQGNGSSVSTGDFL